MDSMEIEEEIAPIHEEIVSIESPYFCAGVVLFNKKAVYTAPILHYMKGWTLQYILKYCKKKGWRWEKVEAYADPQTKESAYLGRVKATPRADNRVQRARPQNNKPLH